METIYKRDSNLITYALVLLIPLFMGLSVHSINPNLFSEAYNKAKSLIMGSSVKEVSVEDSLNAVSVFAEDLAPIYAKPKTLYINSINLEASIIPVGVEDSGSMETPKNWDEVGWFTKSSFPSEQKLMILNGHYDNNYGAPAVFYGLKNISIGDKVSVLDENNKYFTYVIVDSFFIDIKDPLRTEIFDNFNEDESTLVMITCGGIWNSVAQTYTQRLVIRAEYID